MPNPIKPRFIRVPRCFPQPAVPLGNSESFLKLIFTTEAQRAGTFFSINPLTYLCNLRVSAVNSH